MNALARAIAERDEARRAARDCLAEREHLLETVCSLRDEAAGWRRRAEALYDACDPEIRDGVVGCITTIEGLPEVAG